MKNPKLNMSMDISSILQTGSSVKSFKTVKRGKAADNALNATSTKDGAPVTVEDGKKAWEALEDLIEDTLSDSMDLIRGACLALPERAKDHAGKVLDALIEDTLSDSMDIIRAAFLALPEQSQDYAEDENWPLQEVHRTVREAVQNSGVVWTDPRNGHSYLEEITPDGVNHVDVQEAECRRLMLECLDLTPWQREILNLRLQGYGYRAIGTYLHTSSSNVRRTMLQIQKKLEKQDQTL